MERFQRAKGAVRSPVVLSREEVAALLAQVEGTVGLMLELLYGAGLRLMECVRLRIRDVDCERLQVTVRNGKGDRDRVTVMPECLAAPLRKQVARVAHLHGRDVLGGFGAMTLAGGRRLDTARDLGWQFVFPSARIVQDLASGSCSAGTAIRMVTVAVRSPSTGRRAAGWQQRNDPTLWSFSSAARFTGLAAATTPPSPWSGGCPGRSHTR